MRSKVINLAVASVVCFSSLFVSSSVSGVGSRAIAQTVTPATAQNQCKNTKLLALYKKIDELITRIGLGITYPEFRAVFIDAKLIEKDLKELSKTDLCYGLQYDLTLSLEYLGIGKMYWERGMDGTDFLSVNNILIEFLLKQLPDMETLGNGKYIATDNAVKGYFNLGKLVFENIKM
ncbi:hypothetical protein Cylst_6388 (plasmid) [Cylindrospermum stagnale PCC 7417]|uniref:Uncharacterized protein n=1 Tax=Cylindrospermum stagnale PCC 7417 TaxID=56107 RepID=K9X980_9NOST|nr:hypothetical protein [Cylindrospermum stagnale]AFZ28606.1 hypothetical protein Cylst_6388 [Cylindrospermum stagnale PCC 7417]